MPLCFEFSHVNCKIFARRDKKQPFERKGLYRNKLTPRVNIKNGREILTKRWCVCHNAVDTMCRCDGIGRRSGLKIHRSQGRAGSSPATGTNGFGYMEGKTE